MTSPAPRPTVPTDTGEAVGHVAGLHRYPLKSAAGEPLTSACVTPAGLDQDRRWLLVDDSGAPVTAREAPGLRDVAVRVEAGRLLLEPQHDLGALAGRPVHLDDTGAAHAADAAAVHLVSVGAAADPDAPGGCDPEPRANLVLDLAGRPGTERAWTGRRLRVGSPATGVVLRVTRTPKRCLGVYAEVEVPGTVATGDVVTLLDA